MVLQPFVENAIRHGIAPREARGTVDIRAERSNGRLKLTVRDDGVGFGTAPVRGDRGKGIGINNTRARLAQLYGHDFVLDVAPNEPGGVVVTVELPYRTG
jgi:sensor histidine kinase YesM